MITAQQARDLDPARNLEGDLATLSELIERAALTGKKSIRVPHKLCKANGYSIKFVTPGVEDALVTSGYKVTERSEDRQFVDVWIEVSWADPTPPTEEGER